MACCFFRSATNDRKRWVCAHVVVEENSGKREARKCLLFRGYVSGKSFQIGMGVGAGDLWTVENRANKTSLLLVCARSGVEYICDCDCDSRRTHTDKMNTGGRRRGPSGKLAQNSPIKL